MVRLARALGLTLALGLAGTSRRALAQETPPPDSAAEARQQYQLGAQAFKDRRYAEAAMHFEAAAALRVNAVALYTAGLAWDLAPKPERAADAYWRALEAHGRALEAHGLDPKQVEKAKDRLAALEKTLGTLVVTAPEVWKVQLDSFTEVPTPAKLHGAPGVHSLSVHPPGRPVEHRDVSLEVDKVTNLELKDEPKIEPEPKPEAKPEAKPAPAPVAVRESFWTTRRVIGVGVGGFGVAALGATAILGTSANDAADAYQAAPTRASYDHASSLQTWTNVSLVAGLVLAAGGAVLVLMPDKDSEVRVGVGPAGAAVGGRF